MRANIKEMFTTAKRVTHVELDLVVDLVRVDY